MKGAIPKLLALLALAAAFAAIAPAAEGPPFTRKQDVIYGRKDGTALTMDVFTPKGKANGAAVIHVISGGWFSSHDHVNPGLAGLFTRRGYTVFAVVHGSQPKFTIPEVLGDMNRAVRFIRHHGKDYGIAPDRLGICGASAGGHLSLMQGTGPAKADPWARDPIDRESSRVQAVAAFFPPTDFLNYGGEGKYAFGPGGVLAPFRAAVDVRAFDPKTHLLERVADEKKVRELARRISPITHVSADDAPTLIVHGDAELTATISAFDKSLETLQREGLA